MSRALCVALLLVAGCGDDEPITHYDLSVEYDLAVRDLSVPPDLTRPTWHAQTVPVTTSLYGIYGAAGEIFAVGDRGVILRSNDNGARWGQENSGTTAALFGVWTDGSTTIAVGYHGTLLRSVDDGATWQESILGSATLRRVFGAGINGDGGGGLQLWAVGEGGTVLQSNDSGLTWTSLSTSAAGDLHGVWASYAETFVVGHNLVRTRDDGLTWTTLQSQADGVDVWASGSGQLLYAGGDTIFRSRDGGLTWGSVPLAIHVGSNGSYVGFAAFGNGELWAAKSDGEIAHAIADFDEEVDADYVNLDLPVQAIWGSDPRNLFIVGDNGYVAHRE